MPPPNIFVAADIAVVIACSLTSPKVIIDPGPPVSIVQPPDLGNSDLGTLVIHPFQTEEFKHHIINSLADSLGAEIAQKVAPAILAANLDGKTKVKSVLSFVRAQLIAL